MRGPDLDKERSEKSRSMTDFLELYNKDLPASLPRASTALLEEFRSTHANIFKTKNMWSLDQHRKKFMDWIRSKPV